MRAVIKRCVVWRFPGEKHISAFVFIMLTFHNELLVSKAPSSLSLSPCLLMGAVPWKPFSLLLFTSTGDLSLSLSVDPQPHSFNTLSVTPLYSSSPWPCTRWRRPWYNPLLHLITNVRMQSSNPCSVMERRAAGWLAYPAVVGDGWRGRGNDNETR